MSTTGGIHRGSDLLATAVSDASSDASDSDSGDDCPAPPKDLKNLARCLFFLQGMSTLFPFNTYVTANAYFSVRLKGTPYEENFENTFSMATMLSNTVGFVLALAMSKSHNFNIRASVAVPLMVITTTLALSTICVLQEDMEPELLFKVSLASVAVCAVSAAFLQMGIFGFAARFPPQITHAVLVGQGSAGIVISLLSLLTTLTEQSADDIASSAFVYFLIATSVVLVTLVGLCFMSRLDFAVYYAFGASHPGSRQSQSGFVTPRHPTPPNSPDDSDPDLQKSWERRQPAIGTPSKFTPCKRDALESPECSTAASDSRRPETPSTISSYKHESLESPLLGRKHSVPALPCRHSSSFSRRSSLLSYKRDILESPVCSAGPSPVFRTAEGTFRRSSAALGPASSNAPLSLWGIVKRISGSLACVVMSLMVTLTVFPALMVEMRPASNPSGAQFPEAGRMFGDLWIPSLFLTFNVCDTLGRMLSGTWAAWPRLTALVAVARFAFIPVLLFMSVPPTEALPALWARSRDIASLALVGLIALSSGLIHGSAMIHGPSCVPTEFKSRAGTIMAFSLQTGLLLGSASSCVIHALR